MSVVPRALLGVSLLALAAPALARDDDPQTIVVTGERADPEAEVLKTPGGVDVVDAATYADKAAVSLRDALAFSPGVYAQPRFGQEVRLSIRGSGLSRGFHMRGLLLMQDGVPINLADNNGDFQELDPQVFERIEVYRGGNALRFGGSTLGGAINAVTPTGRSAPGVEARIDGGSWNTGRFKLAAGMASGAGDGYLAITGDASDGDRDHARRRSLRLNGNVGLQLAPAVQTRFYASANHIRQDLPGALTLDQALTDPSQVLPALVAQDQARDIDSLRLQNRTTIAIGAGRIEVGAFLNDKQLDHPIFQVIDQKSTDYGAFARIDLAGEMGGMPVEASIGSTARFGHVRARQYVNVGGRRGALTADARQMARTIDSYGELRLTFVPRLTLVTGGVFTHGERAVANRLAPARSGEASFDAFSPKLGLLFEPSSAIQFYGNINRSVELPGFSELNQTPYAVGGVVTPGFVDVAPQRAWTAEIGTRGSVGIARWDVTLYRADLRGELLQFDQAPGVPAATFNAGRTRHQGVEAALDLSLAPWLTLRQAYQLNDFRFRGDAQFGDNRLPVIARHLYRGELRLGSEALALAPNVEWVPEGAWADYANTVRVPGYALVGLGATAQLRSGVTLFVDARNLGGKRAIGDVSAVVRASDASAIYYPTERRAVFAGIRGRL
ncbi:TonB-dependent receptor [Sphingomonas sp. Y38-1Y]|uniref:TonB-dependent receptor family protein n=1 Tax=Sphingomonas sp. Y38-1Y TaxID=3078265 RepID=UPI0028E385E1|nr:TonB-dependent receptor [Sphingomonas sp. Y38-1Y]